MLTAAELASLARATAEIVKQAIAPLIARIAQLEARTPERGEAGPPGVAGPPGESVRGEKGERGEAGPPGADASVDYDDILKAVGTIHEQLTAKYILDIERRVNEVIQRAIDRIPPPAAPPPDAATLRTWFDETVERFAGKYALDFEVRANSTLQQVINALPAPRDGRDGLGFDDFSVSYDGQRGFVFMFIRDGRTKEFPFTVPLVLDRGYWNEGMQCAQGDAVTHEGTLWIAIRDTKARPGFQAKEDWRIGARGGRDGKDGKNGRDAPAAVLLNAR